MTASRAFRTELSDGGVHFELPPNARCPCGASKEVAACCAESGRLFKKCSPTTPKPAPKTGQVLNSCYARGLDDCDATPSREHYVSAALLEHLHSLGGLRVTGLPWQTEALYELPPAAYVARILCTRHNSALSPLDSIAKRLFDAFHEDPTTLRGPHLFLFSGHDIERWLLKVLCGMAASDNLSIPVDTAIPVEWIQTLFGERDFSDGQGLYVCKQLAHTFEGSGVSIRPIGTSTRVTGLAVTFSGYEMLFSMVRIAARTFEKRAFVYRPFELHTIGTTFEKSLVLSWKGAADGGSIRCINPQPV